jgi:thiol-disulfide isomerase/thioredoxin
MRTAPFRTLVVPIVAVAGLVLAACGGGSSTSGSATSDPDPSGATAPVPADAGVPTTASPAAAAGPVDGVDLTDIRMEDLTAGGEVALADALDAPAGTPVLAFFWAPFCSTCRSEAPVLEELAQQPPNGLRIVGVGALDDLGAARDFRTDTAVRSFPLLWAEDTDAWSAFGVPAQPYLLMIRDGQVVQRWPGGASADEITAAASA